MNETLARSAPLTAFLYSESSSNDRALARSHIGSRLAYPDPNSPFDQQFGSLKYLMRMPIVRSAVSATAFAYLQRQQYDAMIVASSPDILGFAAFQTHPDQSLRMFSVNVLPEFRGRGLAQYMVEETLEYAKRTGLRSVQIGAGNHTITNRIHQRLADREHELGILLRSGNWIDILPSA